VFGPLCHPGDIVVQNRDLPRLEVGDVLAVMDAGAYFIPNQMNFSNPRPAAVMIANGKAEVIRGRESFEDVVRLDGV
jgi:diaminopimelate decarboxylase